MVTDRSAQNHAKFKGSADSQAYLLQWLRDQAKFRRKASGFLSED